MSWKAPQIALYLIGVLHLLFMVGELYPWNCPRIMAAVLKERRLVLADTDQPFVATVVHNAGIYNGIVALALFVSASYGSSAFGIQVALLIGGIVAGLFGAATLTIAVIAQAIAGAIALAVVWFCR